MKTGTTELTGGAIALLFWSGVVVAEAPPDRTHALELERPRAAKKSKKKRTHEKRRRQKPPVEEPDDRSIRVAPSFQVLIFEPFPETSRFGTGVWGSYEFMLSRAFYLGIHLAYRFFPGDEQLHQIGYGLLMRHYLHGTDSDDSVFMPFLEYGLLMQMHFQSAHEGYGTSHDTRLAAGTDLRILGEKFFTAAAWHFSRLTLFELEGYKMDYVDLAVGYRYDW